MPAEDPIDAARDQAYFTRGTAKVVAACFALASFGVAIVAGLASDNAASLILIRALIAMIVCYPVGFVIGMICQHVIDDHVRAHKQANPAPDSLQEIPSGSAPRAADAQDDDEEILVV